MNRVAGGALVLALVAGPAAATIVTDATGDFLATFAGPQNGDLDILSVTATYTSDYLILSETTNGAVGTTAGSTFQWGVDRGSGADRLITSGPPAVGTPDILFDAIVRLEANGAGRVVTFPTIGSPTTVLLDPSLVTISGNTITGLIPLNLLPTTGFAVADYNYVNWSRSALGSQSFIADLAPDHSFTASAVPEPASWALIIAGFGLTGGALRRGRRTAPA